MKFTRKTIAAALLLAFLLSVVGLTAPAAAAVGGPEAETKAADGLFRAQFEGREVEGSGEAVDGVYRIAAAKTDGEAWHVKLESNYPTVAGRDYRVTYRFRSDVAGKVKLGDFQEYEIREGENEITGMMIATSGTTYLDLQLGMLPPFTIDFTEVEIEEFADEAEFEDALSAPINFEKESKVYEKHDQGYGTILTRTADEVSIDYVACSWESGIWKSRLYVKTGLIPEPGVHYHVTADVTADEDMPFELLFNNGDEEKGYGALYGQKLAAGETKTVEAVLTGSSDGDELVLQFSLGEAVEGSHVKVGAVRVEKIRDHYTQMLPAYFALDEEISTGRMLTSTIPFSYANLNLKDFSYSSKDTVYVQADDGYVVDLQEAASSATLKISQAPAEGRGVWKVRLYAATGVTLEAGKTYRVKLDVKSAGDQAEYEVVFDGNKEEAYGALKRRRLTAGGTDTIDYLLTPEESRGALTIRLQLGKTDTTAGNTVTLSNLSFETVNTTATDLGPVSYVTDVNVWENIAPEFGMEQKASASGNSASLTVTKASSEPAVWHSRFFIATGVTLEPSSHYRVMADVSSDKAIDDFELLNDNGGAENGYGGAAKGLSAAAGGTTAVSADINTPADGCGELVLRFQLGRSPADNTVTVSNIKVCKVTDGEDKLLSGPRYPEMTEASTQPGSFTLTAPEGAATLTGNGSSATVTVNVGDSGIALRAATGATLTEGKTYRIDMKVEGADYDVCYERVGGGEYDYSGTLSFGETISNTVTASATGELNVLLKLGRVAAGNSITIRDIAVYEQTDELLSYNLGAWIDGDCANHGTSADIAPGATGATATVTSSDGTDWHLKMNLKPEVLLSAGSKYRVTASVQGGSGCFVHFKDGSGVAGWNETAYGDAGFLGSDDSVTVSSSTFDGLDGFVEIVVAIGTRQVSDEVAVSDIKVYKIGGTFSQLSLPGLQYPTSVAESVNLNSFSLRPDGTDAATLTGNGTSASATVVSSGTDIMVCAKTGASLEAGKSYRAVLDVDGDGWGVCFGRDGGGDYEYTDQGSVSFGDGHSATLNVTPTTAGELNILLKLDGVAAGNSVTVRNISVTELGSETVGENLMTASLRAGATVSYQSSEAYSAKLSGTGSSASLAVTSAPDSGRATYNLKLLLDTGKTLEAGKTYRVSADVASSSELDYEIFYGTAANENCVGEKGGLHASASASTAVAEFTPAAAAALVLQFRLGNAGVGDTITVSNVKVEELSVGEPANVIPGFSYDSTGNISTMAGDGYITELEQSGSSASFRILQAPAERNAWDARLIVNTGVSPSKGKGLRVSFDVESAKPQGLFEVFFDGSEELAYGALYEQTLPGGKKSFSYTIKPGDKGALVLQLRPGKTDSTDGNTYTFSNLKIEEVAFTTTSTPEIKTVTELVTQKGYISQLEKSRDRASVRIEKTPAEGREAWKSKLFVETGVTFREGQKYRISMDVKSVIPAPFEVCFNNGGEEKGLGAMYGLISTPSGLHVEYVTYAKQDTDLVLQLSLGNCAAPNTIVLSKVSVERAGKIIPVSDTIYTF